MWIWLRIFLYYERWIQRLHEYETSKTDSVLDILLFSLFSDEFRRDRFP